MTLPVFVVAAAALDGAWGVPGANVRLEGREGHHAATVRRLGPGERVEVTDGAGRRVTCRVVSTARDVLDLAAESFTTSSGAPQPRLVVVQALPKGDRGGLAVELLTEVGADVVVPWAAARCVTVWKGERGLRALESWRNTAREAGKQARRDRFCEIHDLASTAEVARLLSAGALPLVLHESASTSLSDVDVPSWGDVVVVVGPEGGLTEAEVEALAAAGGRVVRMGPTVLRTSTAGAAATAVLLSRCGRWSVAAGRDSLGP